MISFTRDGRDVESFFCNKCALRSNDAICRHVVAGIVETRLTLGKTASATTAVTETNTARAVGSGTLSVFAMPMMIALMEQAACQCLSDVLEDGQTSVGTQISVEHTAASPIGTEITATATIESVCGRKIEFAVTASDGTGEIEKGKHTRVIIGAERFMAKVRTKI